MKKQFINLLFLVFLFIFSTNLADAAKHSFEVTKNVEWANTNGRIHTMDIYVPKTGKDKYPVLIVYHGGGWLINTNSVMDSLAAYIAGNSEYIVCNVNYELLVSDSNRITMNLIIEDAIGAVLWVKDNIAAFRGDITRICVTGDSAGGHLAAMVVLSGRNLETDGFSGPTLGYNPTYLPKGKTAEQVARENGAAVQAAILSYPAVDIYETCLTGKFESSDNFFWILAKGYPRGIFGDSINVTENSELYKAVSPIYLVPGISETKLPPQFIHVGSNDKTTPPELIKAYISKLKENGQQVDYWEYDGKPHAYLDSWKNEFLGTEFTRDAPHAIDKMIEFLDFVFGK
jgi:acetyl esterase